MRDFLHLIFLYWSGFVVIIIIMNSFDVEIDQNSKKPIFRWIKVVVLSVIQTGCLEIRAALDTIGSGSPVEHGPTIIFGIIVIIWLIVDVRAYLNVKKQT